MIVISSREDRRPALRKGVIVFHRRLEHCIGEERSVAIPIRVIVLECSDQRVRAFSALNP
jgi:hypothetical protein